MARDADITWILAHCRTAAVAGLRVVQNRCLKIDHAHAQNPHHE